MVWWCFSTFFVFFAMFRSLLNACWNLHRLCFYIQGIRRWWTWLSILLIINFLGVVCTFVCFPLFIGLSSIFTHNTVIMGRQNPSHRASSTVVVCSVLLAIITSVMGPVYPHSYHESPVLMLTINKSVLCFGL